MVSGGALDQPYEVGPARRGLPCRQSGTPVGTDRRGPQWSWAQQSPFGGDDSVDKVETTRHGRVLRISLPRVGSSSTSEHLAAARHAGEPSYRHSHSSASNAGAGVSRSPSSPREWSCAAASAQPARARRAAAMTIRPLSACNSTSPPRPACSRSGLGIRTPWELPMATMRALTELERAMVTTMYLPALSWARRPLAF